VRVLLVLLLARGVAAAHTGTSSYADISLDERDVDVALQISAADWQPIVAIDANRDGVLTRDEVRANLPRFETYLRTRLRVVADDRLCPGTVVDADTGAGFDAGLTLVRMTYVCPAPMRRLTITSALFVREHPGHRTFAIVRDAMSATTVRQHVFGPGTEMLELRLDWRTTERRQTAQDFLRVGIQQTFARPDHALLVVGILVIAAGLGSAVRSIAAFVLACAMMLAVGALASVADGVVTSALALTVALVGTAGLLPRMRAWAWQVAFACGLLHGLFFAGTFGGMRVSPAALGASLASFAAGIAVAVLVLACCLYPVVAWLRGPSWGAAALRGMSAAVAIAGVGLLVTRVLVSPPVA
jgi:hypothetical protein